MDEKNIFLYETTSKCLVKKINRFPKGCNGIYKDGKLKITRYWNTLDHLHEVPKIIMIKYINFENFFLMHVKLE